MKMAQDKKLSEQNSLTNGYLRDLFFFSSVLTVIFAFRWHCDVKARLDNALADNNLNVTRLADPDYLIFNRVPKVGSQTINNLIGK